MEMFPISYHLQKLRVTFAAIPKLIIFLFLGATFIKSDLVLASSRCININGFGFLKLSATNHVEELDVR